MSERNLDFDTVLDRRNTLSLKYDFAVRRGRPADVLPLWVADMDFKTSSYVQDAVIRQAEHGIFGYSESKEEYFRAVKSWFKRRFDWDVKENWLIKTPGVVFALAMAVKAYTEKGDAVLIQQPVYYPFSEVILDNERRVVSSDLVQGEDGRYQIDFEDFEKKIEENQVKLFFLCNPHNPVGRVWTKEELIRIGDICVSRHVIVVSDEIHQDFVFRGEHQVFAKLKEEYAGITITCTSPGKTFNLAAFQISNIFIQRDELRKRFKKQVDAAGYSQVNVMGLVACKAAYEQGMEWYEAMHAYVEDNIHYIKNFIETRIPEIRAEEPEGTYLVWIDFRGLGLSAEELENLIVNKAGLWLDGGDIFGKTGVGFQRINVACPRATLQLALEKLERAIRE